MDEREHYAERHEYMKKHHKSYGDLSGLPKPKHKKGRVHGKKKEMAKKMAK